MKSEEAYSILDIVSESEGQGVVLTRSGSICVSFELREPECYSLTPEDIDRRDGMFREAFKFLPDGTYVHKQDVFLKERYCPDIAGGSFLDRADARHFRGRLYVSHTCVMHFVLSGLKSLEKAYISSPLSYKENLHKEDLARLDEFLEGVDNAVGIIQSMRDTEIAPMSGPEMRDFTAGYTTLFDAPGRLWTYMPTRNSAQERNGHAASPSAMRPFSLTAAWIPVYGTTPFLPPAPCCTIRCWSSLGCTCRTTTS